jgi:hypothetical protein
VSGAEQTDPDGERSVTPVNWYAMLSLAVATLGAFLAVPFFPGGIVASVAAGFLGERGVWFARAQPGRPGRVLSWWAIGLASASFAIACVVALQAEAVLSDPELMREALRQVDATPTPTP